LRHRVEEPLTDNAHASWGGNHTGKRLRRSHTCSPQHSPLPPRVSRSPPPSDRRKDKRKAEPVRSPPDKKKVKPMYPSDSNDTDNINDELAENTPLNSEEEDVICEAIRQSALLYTRETRRGEGSNTATPTANQMSSAFLTKGCPFKASSRKPGPGQRPPGDLKSHLGDPASFSLDRSIKSVFLSTTGHTCINSDSRWNGDASPLWSTANSQPWFWSYGKPFQMAKEAAMIPFDQHSLAQRMAV
jgi:hypothetical protein